MLLLERVAASFFGGYKKKSVPLHPNYDIT